MPVGISLDPDTDVCHARHDFPFHIVLDVNMKGVAFCQTDGIHMEGVLVVIDAGASDGTIFVNQFAVQGVVMSIARRQNSLLDNQTQSLKRIVLIYSEPQLLFIIAGLADRWDAKANRVILLPSCCGSRFVMTIDRQTAA